MTAGQDNTRAKRGTLSRILSLLLVGILGIIVAAGLLLAFPPAGLVKDQIEKAASAAIGRTVTIGDARVKILPVPTLGFDNMTIANADGAGGAQLFQAETINARLQLKPLFSGKAEIESLEIVKPHINLVKDASGASNWTLDTKSQPNAAGGAATLLNGATVKDGLITYTSAGMKEPVRFEKIDATIAADGKTMAKGQIAHHGETAAVDITLGDLLAAMAGKPADLKVAIEGQHLKGDISGIASNSGTPGLAGDIAMTSGSVRDLARWLGADVDKGAAVPGSVKGKFKATAAAITFEGTDVAVGADTGRLTGNLQLDGARPKYTGSIAVPRIDLDAMLFAPPSAAKAAAPEADGELELETAPAWDGLRDTLQNLTSKASERSAAPEALAAAKPSAGAWSEKPIDLKILQSADLDAVITSDQLVLGKLDLKQAQNNAKLTNGKLDAKLEKLTVGAGSATGKLTLDSSKPVPRADVAINLINVAAEPIVTEITGKPLLAGTSNVDIKAGGEGRNQNDLASSLEGKATFKMSKGVIRGFDVRSIVSNWWNSLTGGLKFDINKKTGFEKLDAQYDIKKGVMTSSPGLDIGGSEVELQSRGNVSLPAKRINQEIKVKVVPPPSAPPIPVKISGSWSKPSISMDWGDLLFSSRVAESASPSVDANGAAPVTSAAPDSVAEGFQELAPTPEQIPDDIKAQIKSVLASGEASAITPEGKALLQTLLPPEPVAAPPAAAPAPEQSTATPPEPPAAETPATP